MSYLSGLVLKIVGALRGYLRRVCRLTYVGTRGRLQRTDYGRPTDRTPTVYSVEIRSLHDIVPAGGYVTEDPGLAPRSTG